jgi:Flp pilus assembly protein TadG
MNRDAGRVSGQERVELALILPIFLLLSFGTWSSEGRG